MNPARALSGAGIERQQKLEASVQYRDLILTVAMAIYVLLVQLEFVAFRPSFLAAVVSLFIWNRAAAGFYRRQFRTNTIAWISGFLDIAVSTVLIRESGGLNSALLPLYFIIIVGATVHFNALFGAVLLGVAGLSLSALATPEFFGLAPAASLGTVSASGGGVVDATDDPRYQLIAIASFVALLVPVIYSSALLATKLQTREIQLRRANRNLNVLYEIGSPLSNTLSTDSVVETIVKGLSRSFKMARTELFLLSSDGELKSVMRVPDSTWTQNDQDATTRLDELSSRLEEPGPIQEGRKIFLPIRTKARMLGLLVAEQPPPGRALDGDELNTIRLLAGQAGIAVENARLYETTERLSRMDGLTHLYNHRFFHERIQEEFKRSDRFRQTLSLLMIDVDDFKRINDTFGHQAGDEMLRRLARVLRETLREVDVPARYGGDEFAIILPDTDLNEASEVAERLRKSVEKHDFPTADTAVTLTLSLGTASRAPQSPVSAEELIKAADHALYQAKNAGRNQVATYPSEPELNG